jgi:ERF superfamily
MDKKENTTTKENKSMNLHQKLVEIRKVIPYLQKNAPGHNFKYVSAATIIELIKPVMDELGVLLHIDFGPPTIFPIKETIKGTVVETYKFWSLALVEWIDAANPQDRYSSHYPAFGDISKEMQATGMASTYVNRYNLLNSLSIACDKEDPDTFENMLNKIKSDNDKLSDFLNETQIKTISVLADEERVKRICSTYNANSLNEVPAEKYDFIMHTLVVPKRKAEAGEVSVKTTKISTMNVPAGGV